MGYKEAIIAQEPPTDKEGMQADFGTFDLNGPPPHPWRDRGPRYV